MKTSKKTSACSISKKLFNVKYVIAFFTVILFQFTVIAQPQWTPLDSSNIAHLKPAKQSSVHGEGGANRVVDGNTDGNWGAASVSHTETEDGPWWEVNLLAPHDISSITLYNRTDCCSDRLKNFTIRVSDQPFNGNYGGSVYASETEWFQGNKTYSGAMRGQYIRIHLNDRNALSIAEVVVRGKPVLELREGVWTAPLAQKKRQHCLGQKNQTIQHTWLRHFKQSQ